MKTFMKASLFATLFLLAESAFAQVSIGIQIGQPPPPPRVVYVTPARPAPDFVWVNGYWYPSGKQYKWKEGYWVRPPYAQGVWVVPHYSGGRYFEGYWLDKAKDKDKGKSNGRGRGHNK